MNIDTNKYNYYKRISPNNNPFGAGKLPLKKDINFTSSLAQKAISEISQKNGQTIYKNANLLKSKINDVLGENFAEENIFKNLNFDETNDTLSYTTRRFRGDLAETGRSIVGIPIRIINSVCEKMKVDPGDFITRWVQQDRANFARNNAIDIVELFSGGAKKGEINLDSCQEKFSSTVGNNITKIKKGYLTRDERTLNRITTSTVSALYSGADFYNLSMVQKDDKEEAKKAQNARIGQELKRMAMSAGMTYITLGALDRYTRKNIWLNAGVIAGSALFSEILSRVLSGTSLVPLSPERAAKIANKQKTKKAKNIKKEIKQPQQELKKENVTFKANLNKEEKIFKNFAGQNGKINTLSNLTPPVVQNDELNTSKEKPKKKNNIFGIIFALIGGASAFYFLSKKAKGDYTFAKAIKKYYNEYNNIKTDAKLTNETREVLLLGKINDFNAANLKHENKINKFSFMKKFKDFITVKKSDKPLTEIWAGLEKLQKACQNEDDKKILQIYEKHIMDSLNPTIDECFSESACTISNGKTHSLDKETKELIIKMFKNGINDEDVDKIIRRIKTELISESDIDALIKMTEEGTDDINSFELASKFKRCGFTQGYKFDILTKHASMTQAGREELVKKINALNNENLSKTEILNVERNLIKECIGEIRKTTIKTEKEYPVLPGLYSGITKVFNTVYTILSSPAMLIDNMIHKHYFEESAKFAKKYLPKDYQKELSALSKIIESNNTEKAIQEITARSRNIAISPETGDLANISRTMVTAIGTYFFVNDYRNKVLIESEGKDIQGAQEEMNDRIAHKISNFVINGTLMNTFNSVGAGLLNKNLLGAAAVAGTTELANEALVRKSICQPIFRKKSKQEILDHEEKQLNRKGFLGWWARTFMKITGKKNLTQKAGIKKTEQK